MNAEMHQQEEKSEIRIGPFSLGDIIALMGIVFMSGGLWIQVAILQKQQDQMSARINALEQVVPTEYVRRQDYRDDMREVKELLRRIEVKVDTKVDKP